MNIIKMILASVVALCILLEPQEQPRLIYQLQSKDQFFQKERTVYIITSIQNDYGTEDVRQSFTSRLPVFFFMACIFLCWSEELLYFPPIRRIIVGIKRDPKFRPQKARSTVSDDDYFLHYTPSWDIMQIGNFERVFANYHRRKKKWITSRR